MSGRTVFLVLLAASLAWARPETVDIAGFGSIPVLDNGRHKPIDSYARNMLLQFSGLQRVGKLSAAQWLAAVLFEPRTAHAYKIFLVNNPEIADALGIAPEKRRRYSFAQLHGSIRQFSELATKAMNTSVDARTAFDTEILRLWSAVGIYVQLTGTLDFAGPGAGLVLSDCAAADSLQLPCNQPVSYLDMLSRSARLSRHLRAVNPDQRTWSISDSAIVGIAHAFYQYAASLDQSPVRIISSGMEVNAGWISPGEFVKRRGTQALDSKALDALIRMREAFRAGDMSAFSAAAMHLLQANPAPVPSWRLALEKLYNGLNTFFWAQLAYGLALALVLMSLIGSHHRLRMVTLVCICAGLAMHTAGIAMRAAIILRPPVTNLYETFVFVAWASVVLGIVIEILQRSSIGLLVAAVLGSAILHVGRRFGASSDTMGMLVAVLNSNFWLATHIITISLGYAGCVSAGVIGHVHLVQRMCSAKAEALQSSSRALYGMFVFGLAFTVVGTMLGGMWADQAWGRFWGWDPKENGALLIILWAAATLHARAGKMIGDFGMAICAIVGLTLVVFAWIGVNLLGVGLHSYGFTSSGAWILWTVTGAETVFLLIAIVYCKAMKNALR